MLYRRTIQEQGQLRTALKQLVREGRQPEQMSELLGISRAHVYRVMKQAKIRPYYLTQYEAELIDEHRKKT